MKLPAIEAASRFIMNHFPNCDGAVLSGSVSRGLGTATSDLDIVIIDESIESAYRKSLIEDDWMIELFVHSTNTYEYFFQLNCNEGMPILPRMIGEGFILKDGAPLQQIRAVANKVLQDGPKPWDDKTVLWKRYLLSDALDDFVGVTRNEEAIFIAANLAQLLHEFVLWMNGHWIGKSKWIYRELEDFDPVFAHKFVNSFEVFYKTGEKQPVIGLTEQILDQFGGRFFEGYEVKSNKKS